MIPVGPGPPVQGTGFDSDGVAETEPWSNSAPRMRYARSVIRTIEEPTHWLSSESQRERSPIHGHGDARSNRRSSAASSRVRFWLAADANDLMTARDAVGPGFGLTTRIADSPRAGQRTSRLEPAGNGKPGCSDEPPTAKKSPILVGRIGCGYGHWSRCGEGSSEPIATSMSCVGGGLRFAMQARRCAARSRT